MTEIVPIHSHAPQGDVFFKRLDKLPEGLVEVPRNGPLVVCHSETGHNHEIRDAEVRMFRKLDGDPMVAYLMIDGDYADVVHCRSFDTHKTRRLFTGAHVVIRQRESAHTPEGWRIVSD